MNFQTNRLDFVPERLQLLLCALLLLGAQISLDFHLLDHLTDTDSEHCEICLAGSGLENTAIDSTPPVSAQFSSLAITPGLSPSVVIKTTTHYRQRAPPLFSPTT
ncbi:MAG: hypothetical protein JMN25_04390 [gamma proteobacterium endosymbiont of Lamellibrachia anaximandri]|nr:hypothetical protein [gamma proteobacterium endosymbiont of Lamellibrachia anaximandri]